MHYVEREAVIIEKLRQHGKVMVNELAEELDVTPMTIRRDLSKLEQMGVLQKVHGAAVPLDILAKERAFVEKKLIHADQKIMIAREALRLISEGETVLLDAGTTTYEMARLLKDGPRVNVVTGDIHIAMELCSAAGQLFFIGGEIEKDTGRAEGAKAARFLSDINVDTAFLGVSSVSSEMDLCSFSVENAELKKCMIRCGKRKVLLADDSKFDTNAFAKVAPLGLMDVLITDRNLTTKELEYLQANGVEYCRVG